MVHISENRLVSIIIPIHNRFDLAFDAITRVIQQTHRPLEIILFDDASDPPFEYSHSYQSHSKDLSIQIIRSNRNIGPGASREFGRQQATGDFICYLDSDDLWHEQKVEKQVLALQQNPQAGMCYCTSLEFTKLPLSGDEKTRKASNREFHEFLPVIFSGRPWDTSACMWTRGAADQVGPWFAGWAWEDYAYDCKAGCMDIRICFVPEALCYYRVNHGEAQLSKTDRRSQMLHRAESVMQMNQDLRDSGKLGVPAIKNAFVKSAYTLAMHLFYLEEKRAGLDILQIALENSRGNTRRISSLGKMISPFVKSRLLGDLLYRNRDLL